MSKSGRWHWLCSGWWKECSNLMRVPSLPFIASCKYLLSVPLGAGHLPSFLVHAWLWIIRTVFFINSLSCRES